MNLTIKTFGSYIWLRVSIKVVTLFIHWNHHSGTPHTLYLSNKDFLMWSVKYIETVGMGQEIHMCILHTTLMSPPTTTTIIKKSCQTNVHLRLWVKDVYSIRNAYKFICQSHAPKTLKIRCANNVRTKWFFPHDMDRLQFNELNE